MYSFFKLVNLEVKKEDDKFYLDYTYEYTHGTTVEEVILYRVPVNNIESVSCIGGFDDNNNYCITPNTSYVRFGTVEANNIATKTRIIRETVKDMTIEEIEKGLGYKINIVGSVYSQGEAVPIDLK